MAAWCCVRRGLHGDRIGLDWGNNMQLAECLIKCGGGMRACGWREGESKEREKGRSFYDDSLGPTRNGLLDRSEQMVLRVACS